MSEHGGDVGGSARRVGANVETDVEGADREKVGGARPVR